MVMRKPYPGTFVKPIRDRPLTASSIGWAGTDDIGQLNGIYAIKRVSDLSAIRVVYILRMGDTTEYECGDSGAGLRFLRNLLHCEDGSAECSVLSAQ